MARTTKPALRKAFEEGIIAGAQITEHYDLAAYGSLTAWAKALRHHDAPDSADATLEDERAADEER